MKNFQLVPPMLNLAGLYLKKRSKEANQKKRRLNQVFSFYKNQRNKDPILLLNSRLQGYLNVRNQVIRISEYV
jgi:hypothetical protein